jgi:hypothetical protein
VQLQHQTSAVRTIKRLEVTAPEVSPSSVSVSDSLGISRPVKPSSVDGLSDGRSSVHGVLCKSPEINAVRIRHAECSTYMCSLKQQTTDEEKRPPVEFDPQRRSLV